MQITHRGGDFQATLARHPDLDYRPWVGMDGAQSIVTAVIPRPIMKWNTNSKSASVVENLLSNTNDCAEFIGSSTVSNNYKYTVHIDSHDDSGKLYFIF